MKLVKSRPKPCTPSNTDDIPLSNKVKAMVKEDVFVLLEKNKRKCNIVISNLEEDHDNANNVNDESSVKSLLHDVLQAGDIEIVSAVGATGIQHTAYQRTCNR